jgi:hypothetical protein
VVMCIIVMNVDDDTLIICATVELDDQAKCSATRFRQFSR